MSSQHSPLVMMLAGVIDAVRRRVAQAGTAARRLHDGWPGWAQRLTLGVAALALVAMGAGGAVGLSVLARRLGVAPVVSVRVWGTAGLVQLAVGGALAVALSTLDTGDPGGGRLPARGVPLGRRGQVAVATLTVIAVVAAVLLAAGVAQAAVAPPAPAPVPSVANLDQVITNARNWTMGILAGTATLFASTGALRYMGANGDPAEVERAKGAFKSAGVGYALAVLAPVLLIALQSVVGG